MKDVIVVGAGPAGTSIAKNLADEGLDVLVLEKREEIGAPKRCGEGLSSNSAKKLNLDIPKRCIAQKINGAIVYAPNGEKLTVEFGKDTSGLVLERKLFDKWLAEEAARAGSDILTKSPATGLLQNNKGVKANIMMEGEQKLESKMVVAADGFESKIMRMAGIKTNKSPDLVDSGYQYEMSNLDLEDENKIVLYFGNKLAPRGYTWIFPKGKDRANVGIGISATHKKKTAKAYLDSFIEKYKINGSILEVNAGAIPVGGLMKNMVSDNLLGIGDAVNQVNAIHGGGIGESIKASRIASKVIKKGIEQNDTSKKTLKEYNKIWWEKRGNQLRKVEKVREIFERLDDTHLNNFKKALSAEDLVDLAHGKKLSKVAKILAKYNLLNLKSKVGL